MLARDRYQFSGSISSNRLDRLQALVHSAGDDVSLSVNFSFSDDGYIVIRGQVRVDVERICRRCDRPLTSLVQSTFCLVPVDDDDQAKQLPSAYDPVLKTGTTINLLEAIEEELILSLPLQDRHAKLSDCEATPVGSTQDTYRPFVDLGQMLNKRNEK